MTSALLGSRITVAGDLGADLVSIELRHALQLQKMTTWLLGLPTSCVVDQIYAGVLALQAKAMATPAGLVGEADC